jgi:hypothetical protein
MRHAEGESLNIKRWLLEHERAGISSAPFTSPSRPVGEGSFDE